MLLVHALTLGATLFSFDNGSHPDEETYVAVSDELRWAHVLTPMREGEAVFFKPPLLYWAQAASLNVFGRHLWAARLPSYLATLLLGLAVYVVLRRVYRVPSRLALVAASGTLSAVATVRFGTLGMMDAPFSLALFLAFSAAVASRERPRWLLASGALVAVAILLKGPIGLLLGVGLCVVALVVHRKPVEGALPEKLSAGSRAATSPFTLSGVEGPTVSTVLAACALCLTLAAPWFLIEWLHYGREFLTKFVLHEHLAKVQGGRTLGGEVSLLVLPALAALPWLPLGRPSQRVLRPFTWAVGFIVAAYALQSSRQLHYALPCVPFVVTLATLSRRSRVTTWAARALVPLAVALLALAVIAGVTPIGGLALGCALLVTVMCFALERRHLLAASLTWAVLWAFIFGAWTPRYVPPTWPTPLAAAANGERVLLFDEDVGVARLESGLDLHRVTHPVTDASPGELWLHRDSARPGLVHLATWPRLKLKVTPDQVWHAVLEGDVSSLTETWALSRAP